MNYKNESDDEPYFDPTIMKLDGIVFSGLGDVIIPMKHFGMFPWNEFNIRDSNVSGVSSGGYPLKDHECTFCLWVKDKRGEIHKSLKQYRWCIPESLTDFIRYCKERGRMEIQSELQSLIGKF